MTDGVATLPSALNPQETVAHLLAALKRRGLTVFAMIDHAQAAAAAGLEMNAALLVIFGSPLTGTPLMRLAPTLAIDLPLKALVWEDADGATWLSYNEPAWLAHRHGLGASEDPQLRSMARALGEIAREATLPIAA